jgi:putative heme iron utilization protein
LTRSDDPREDYLALRESAVSVQLATLTLDKSPEASYAPCVWLDGDCYLFLSGLSSHSANLEANPEISLLLLDEAAKAPNAFARKRASLRGRAQFIKREDELFGSVMTAFNARFGKIMQIIEPLPDFRLFRVVVTSGSFIRGFGQAYELDGAGLDQLLPVDPRK